MGAAAIAGTLVFKNGEARALMIPLVLIPYLLIKDTTLWMVLLGITQLLILGAKIGVFYLSRDRQKVATQS
jgi:hypothetical protein